MSIESQTKIDAIDFVSKILLFQQTNDAITNFFNEIGDEHLDNLKNFLKVTDLLYYERTVSGNFSVLLGETFSKMANHDINVLVEELNQGKYDFVL